MSVQICLVYVTIYPEEQAQSLQISRNKSIGMPKSQASVQGLLNALKHLYPALGPSIQALNMSRTEVPTIHVRRANQVLNVDDKLNDQEFLSLHLIPPAPRELGVSHQPPAARTWGALDSEYVTYLHSPRTPRAGAMPYLFLLSDEPKFEQLATGWARPLPPTSVLLGEDGPSRRAAFEQLTVPGTRCFWVIPGVVLAGPAPVNEETLRPILDRGVRIFVDLRMSIEGDGYEELANELLAEIQELAAFRDGVLPTPFASAYTPRAGQAHTRTSPEVRPETRAGRASRISRSFGRYLPSSPFKGKSKAAAAAETPSSSPPNGDYYASPTSRPHRPTGILTVTLPQDGPSALGTAPDAGPSVPKVTLRGHPIPDLRLLAALGPSAVTKPLEGSDEIPIPELRLVAALGPAVGAGAGVEPSFGMKTTEAKGIGDVATEGRDGSDETRGTDETRDSDETRTKLPAAPDLAVDHDARLARLVLELHERAARGEVRATHPHLLCTPCHTSPFCPPSHPKLGIPGRLFAHRSPRPPLLSNATWLGSRGT